ncbi:zinc-ribbon domain-containing protein [Oceanobacillus jeddahense]|uniref:Zinc-ribbon domain-containing protein n=1 Tax=Oceanobacillus jeddahense TaxID=1462527 RepID=A0ABY5JN83_9BACI|nr:zinc-ribbon domain-containing protein [Oceanobacillus jeddahense]UUI01753.1 zinc-ribbon domain-containing protein [Oceanobacillus jeddahense]
MYCSKCGNKLTEDSKFCSKCGELITSEKSDSILKKMKPTTYNFQKVVYFLEANILTVLLGFILTFLLNTVSNVTGWIVFLGMIILAYCAALLGKTTILASEIELRKAFFKENIAEKEAEMNKVMEQINEKKKEQEELDKKLAEQQEEFEKISIENTVVPVNQENASTKEQETKQKPEYVSNFVQDNPNEQELPATTYEPFQLQKKGKALNIIIILFGTLPLLIVGAILFNIGIMTDFLEGFDVFLSSFGVGVVFISVLLNLIYYLPTLLCYSEWKWLIFILNLFFSWTIFGWFILLVVGLMSNKNYEQRQKMQHDIN